MTMARKTEPAGWRPRGSAPVAPPRRGIAAGRLAGLRIPTNLRLPLVIGACVLLVAGTVVGAVGFSSPAQAGDAPESAPAATAAQPPAPPRTDPERLPPPLRLPGPQPPAPPTPAPPAAP